MTLDAAEDDWFERCERLQVERPTLSAGTLAECNEAARRLLVKYPKQLLEDLGDQDFSRWLVELHAAEAELLSHLQGDPGDLGGRFWVDVQLADGTWGGRWADRFIVESVVNLAYWWLEERGEVVAAGACIGPTKEELAAAAAEKRRAAKEQAAMNHGLLALLVDEEAS